MFLVCFEGRARLIQLELVRIELSLPSIQSSPLHSTFRESEARIMVGSAHADG